MLLQERIASAAFAITQSTTYGDFASYITDPHYSDVATRVTVQLIGQLVALGPGRYQLHQAFTDDDPDSSSNHYGEISAYQDAPLLISQRRFLAGLASLGLKLGAMDAQRLLVRFCLPPDTFVGPAASSAESGLHSGVRLPAAAADDATVSAAVVGRAQLADAGRFMLSVQGAATWQTACADVARDQSAAAEAAALLDSPDNQVQ